MTDKPKTSNDSLREWIVESWREALPLESAASKDADAEAAEAARALWRCFAFSLRYHPEDLLKHPKTTEQLRREAVSALEDAAYSIERLDRSSSPARDLSSAILSASAAFTESLDFFMAANADSYSLPHVLLGIQERIQKIMVELEKNPMTARLMEADRLDARRRAERWRGKGTRGLDIDAPRNRLVLRLFGEIEDLQSTWKDLVCGERGLPPDYREPFKAKLHERVREIIALPPLSPASASRYHRVGITMLNDATGIRGVSNFCNHPAFQRGGEFYELVISAKAFTGALSEAWKNVARLAAKGH